MLHFYITAQQCLFMTEICISAQSKLIQQEFQVSYMRELLAKRPPHFPLLSGILLAFFAVIHIKQKTHSRLSCKLLFFFKARIIIFPQASTRYLTSDIVFFSSDNEAEQHR